MKQHRIIMAGLMLSLGISVTAGMADDAKIIFASATPTPPKIDGVLDDECWKNTEMRSDFHIFTQVSGRETRIRLVYDEKYLYIGLEFDWDEAGKLEKCAQAIWAKYGEPQSGLTDIKQYGFEGPSTEIFIDPGLTRENYYCVYANAGGQWTGWYKYYFTLFDRFKLDKKVEYQWKVKGKCWSVEIAYPIEGVRTGDEWGFNVGRNDEGPYLSIWSFTGISAHTAGKFGKLIFGSYRQWWDAEWQKYNPQKAEAMMRELADRKLDQGWLPALNTSIQKQAGQLEKLAKAHPLSSRKDIESLYGQYQDYKNTFNRLAAAHDAILLLNQP